MRGRATGLRAEGPMGHPGDSYVLRAGKNKDILLDIPTGQGEFHIIKDTTPIPC